MTHNSDHNTDLPKPEHIMERYLWATDELSGLYGAIIRMYPSHSAQDLNLKSVKKKFKNKGFAGGCDREYMEQGAALLGIEVEEMLQMYIDAYQALFE
jgi:lysyl-tRNA synthetase class 2